ncbi:MAG: hypothetical protein B6245_22685 [Desulfobacteraceae bacterium 4572_88]|nr:MAG: hypothetical protein B6245_22685 [Desulfobacteraceae bacterium 4572_88]
MLYYYPSAMIVTGESQRHAGGVRSRVRHAGGTGTEPPPREGMPPACPAVRITDIGYYCYVNIQMTGSARLRSRRTDKSGGLTRQHNLDKALLK